MRNTPRLSEEQIGNLIEEATQNALKSGPTGRTHTVAVKQALEAKMDAIEKLLARNFSTTAIAKLYHKAGIGASAETIRKHIDGLLTQKSASSRSKVKKRVNHKVAASSMPPTETTAQTVASKSGSAFNLDQEPA